MILRELLLKLGLSVDEASFAKGELAAKAIEKGLDLVVDKAKELAAEFVENVKGVIEYGDQLNKAAQSSGIARTALQELRYAASLADISSEDMTASLNFLVRTMREAKEGSQEQAKAFSKLGIRVTDTTGKLRSVDDVIGDAAAKLSKMPDGAEKSAAAMQLFGRAGARMIPLLNEGRDGLAELREEAHKLGLVMSDEDVKASEELNDNLQRLRAVGQGLWRQAIAPLIPALNTLVKRFLEWRKANAAIMAQKIREWTGYLIKAINGLADVFSFLVRNGEAVKLVLEALVVTFGLIEISAVAAATKTAIAWIAAAAPFIALGALIAGLLLVFDDLRVYQKQLNDPNFKGKSLFGMWAKTIQDFGKERAGEPWWLAALRTFVRLLDDAVNGMLKLDKLLDKTPTTTGKAKAVYNAASNAATNVTTNLIPQAGFAKRADKRFDAARAQGATWLQAAEAGFGFGPFAQPAAPPAADTGQAGPPSPMLYTPPAASGSPNVTIAPQMRVNINANGMRPEEVRPLIREEFDRMTDQIHEDALAGVSD